MGVHRVRGADCSTSAGNTLPAELSVQDRRDRVGADNLKTLPKANIPIKIHSLDYVDDNAIFAR